MLTRLAILRGARLGKGARLYPGIAIDRYARIALGNSAILYKNVTIHLSNLGRFRMGADSHVAPYGYFLVDSQSIEIGDDVAIGPFCCFFCLSNSYAAKEPLFRKNYRCGDIFIGDNVFIGAHCVVLPGARIEPNVIIAAQSTVSGTLESGYIYGGSPARKIKALPG
jgi:acetyltransferase-like isoleucine patch superfamily enzyme